MTAPAPAFGPAGDMAVRAGAAVQPVVVLKDAQGNAIDLTGREFFWSIYQSDGEQEVLTRSAMAVGLEAVLPVLDGDTTQNLHASYKPRTLHILVGYLVDGGYVEVSEGQFLTLSAPKTLLPESGTGDADQVVLTLSATSGRQIVTSRGAPGFSAAQQLQRAGLIFEATVEAMDERYSSTGATAGAQAGAAAAQPFAAAASQSATEAEGHRVATEADAAATAVDRSQTGQDRTATTNLLGATSLASAQAVAASLAAGAYPNAAATSVPAGVANGANYWVLSADGLSFQLYTNNAGAPQLVAGAAFPTASAVSAAFAAVPAIAGATWLWTDMYRRVSAKIRTTGEFWVSKLQAARATISSAVITNLTISGGLTVGAETRSLKQIGSYISVVTDKYGRRAMWQRADGTIGIAKFEADRPKFKSASTGSLIVTDAIAFGGETKTLKQIGSYSFVEMDSYNRRKRWERPDGTVGFAKLERPGRIKVYDQIDDARARLAVVEAAVASGGSYSPAKAKLITGFKRGYYPRAFANPPAVSVGAANGSSTIAGSALVPMTDARFRYYGGTPTLVGPSFPNNTVCTAVASMYGYTDATNTTPVYQSNGTAIEFMLPSVDFNIVFRGSGGSEAEWLTINGRSVPAFAVPSNTNQLYYVRVNASALPAGPYGGLNLIRVETNNSFAGIDLLNPALLVAPTTPAPPIIVTGIDSLWSGVGQAIANSMLACVFGRDTGSLIYNTAVGSTGVLQQHQANNIYGQPLKNLLDPYRLQTLCVPGASALFLSMSQNDGAVTPAIWGPYGATFDLAFENGLHAIIDAFKAVNPGGIVALGGGTWPHDQILRQVWQNSLTAHKVASQRRSDNVIFLEQMRPNPVVTGPGGIGTVANPGTDGQTGNSGLSLGGASGSDTAHPADYGHQDRGLTYGDQFRTKVYLEAA